MYKYKITYINISLNDEKQYSDQLDIINFKNISELEKLLNNYDIAYLKKIAEIENINTVDIKIRKNILNKNNFFKLEQKDYISFIFINKNFVNHEELILNLYRVDTNEKLIKKNLNCEYIKNSNYNLQNKEYEFTKLNDQLRKSLIDIGDYIVFTNNDKYTYIFLCGIKFNKETLNNISINKKINSKASYLESEFVKKYSKIYNLLILNE